MKKILGWLVLAIAVIWLVKNPAQAAADAHKAVHALTTFASSL